MNLNSPTGGAPHGIPRYSETDGSILDAWPTIVPLVVLTACPTTCSAAAEDATRQQSIIDAARLNIMETLPNLRRKNIYEL